MTAVRARFSAALLAAAAFPASCGGEPVGGGRAGAAAPADPADDSAALVARIEEAERTTVYEGWRSIVGGARGQSRDTRIAVARYPTGQSLARWESADGTPRRRWTFAGRFPWSGSPDRAARLVANYRVSIADAQPEAVAFRETRRVEIRPRRPGRPSVDLHVDAETFFVLAETWYGIDGAEVRSHRFESIRFGAPAEPAPSSETPPSTTPPETAERIDGGEGPADALARAPFPALAPAAWPDGFLPVSSEVLPCGSFRIDATDGLAAVSVLQRKGSGAADDASPQGQVRRSRRAGVGSMAARIDGIDVTVSGNVADADLEQVLRSLGR